MSEEEKVYVDTSAIVLVQSKKVNNSSVVVEFKKVLEKFGKSKNVRMLSRTYTFTNFIGKMPLKMARLLMLKNEVGDFRIVSLSKEDNYTKEEVKAYDEYFEKINNFKKDSIFENKKVRHNKKEKYTCPYCKTAQISTILLLGKHVKKEHLDKYESVWKIDRKRIMEELTEISDEEKEIVKKLAKEFDNTPEKQRYEDKKYKNRVQEEMSKMSPDMSEEDRRARAETLISGLISSCCGEKK